MHESTECGHWVKTSIEPGTVAMPAMPATRKLRQEVHMFEASLDDF